LSEWLFREPYRFDFFQAVRVLESLAQERARADPRRGGAPVGHDQPPEQEAVRFRSVPSLCFPVSAIVQLRALAPDAGAPAKPLPLAEMAVAFLGVTGLQGALPYHYTELLIERLREKDFSLRDFLDLFHHRIIALFYRAWVKYRLPIAYERSRLDPAAREDLITWGLYCLAGLGTGGLRGRLEVDDEAFLFYCGHFAHYPRSALVLETILGDYFALPVQVMQLQGQWLQLAPSDRTAMPSAVHPKGLNNRLGVDTVAGERIWDVQSKFRIRIGPLTYSQFRRFMPGGDSLRPLCQLLRTYVGPEWDFDVQLVLQAEEVPWCQLASHAADPPCLGWNSWARAREFTHVVDDPVFCLDEV
jgi:type VI secretion system protein ImpH